MAPGRGSSFEICTGARLTLFCGRAIFGFPRAARDRVACARPPALQVATLQLFRVSQLQTSDHLRIKLGRVRGQEGLPKTTSSQRDTPMLPPVIDALEQLKTGKLANLDDYIFTNKKGLPIDKHLDRI